tara:strand:- start:391 stop:762 length:372 start_codon:yes stop_codon:yes gene_type:complete
MVDREIDNYMIEKTLENMSVAIRRLSTTPMHDTSIIANAGIEPLNDTKYEAVIDNATFLNQSWIDGLIKMGLIKKLDDKDEIDFLRVKTFIALKNDLGVVELYHKKWLRLSFFLQPDMIKEQS